MPLRVERPGGASSFWHYRARFCLALSLKKAHDVPTPMKRLFVLALCIVLPALCTAPALADGIGLCHPILLKQPSANFPKPNIKLKSQKIIVTYTITLEGAVENPAVKQSSGSKIFDQAAVDLVKRYRYQPMSVECGRVETSATFDLSQPAS